MEFNKTNQELEMMSETELFDYLDRKSEYLRQHTKPLSPYLVKHYGYLSTAISRQTGSSDEVYKDISYDGLKKIIEENKNR